MSDLPIINERLYRERCTPAEMDALWADGWRHFGELFFRNNTDIYDSQLHSVFPLRIRLAQFGFSRSQRRVLKKNSDLAVRTGPARITEDKLAMFRVHRQRFRDRVPYSLYDFLSFSPSDSPCETREISVYLDEELVAASFFAVGERSVSAVYGIFDPAHAPRSLGIFTMLREIEIAIAEGKEFYYQGYCYDAPSFYDYKKRFSGLERFDWNTGWVPYTPESG